MIDLASTPCAPTASRNTAKAEEAGAIVRRESPPAMRPIRTMAPDYIDDACQIETTVGAEAAVDVPGHHANSGGAAGQAPPLRQRSINACAPSERESHAPIATRKKIMFASVGFIRMLQI